MERWWSLSRRFGIRFEEPRQDLSPEAVMETFPETPGLYVHVPFCRTICPFCPYNKVPYEAGLAIDYLSHLEQEAAMYLEVSEGPFPSLYVGGGTPTLCLDLMEGLLDRLPVTGARAIEVLPTHMTVAGMGCLVGLGFDYVSLGVQSFDPEVLRRLQRPGSPETSRVAIERARGAFACLDVDLIFDAAFDHPQTLIDDLTECFTRGVDQVSTYPLMRFGFTPFGKTRHARRREHDVLRAATGLAESYGYERRSVWTFNRVGSPSYTSITRPYYLGLGAGSASFGGGLFTVNHFGLDQYRRAVDAGRLPVARIARLPRPAAAAYRAFWQAYTGEVPIEANDPLLAHPLAATLFKASRVLGWSRRKADVYALTPSGYDRYHDLERWVTYQLIEPLWAELMGEHRDAAALGGSS
jgi:coproporphyrinogen III oxidase-like Fe-S oxidoreductase